MSQHLSVIFVVPLAIEGAGICVAVGAKNKRVIRDGYAEHLWFTVHRALGVSESYDQLCKSELMREGESV